VVSLIGRGTPKEDIAFGIVDSIADKVVAQCFKISSGGSFFLTGGLCECPYIVEALSKKLGCEVNTSQLGRFAGAIGAAMVASESQK